MRDLLVAVPLVSRMWQTTTLIPVLQRILFFEEDASSGIKNPLLKEIFAPCLRQVTMARRRVRRINALAQSPGCFQKAGSQLAA
jgi:hypothetical protein